MSAAALLDVDGTLVDTNYHRAVAWFRAFRDQEIAIPVWRAHRHLGMGADQFVAAVAGDRAEAELGDELRAGHARHFRALIDDVELMPDAQRLIDVLHGRGAAIVLASSASEDDLGHFRSMIDRGDLISAATSSADVERTKPGPDLILAAVEKVDGAEPAVMVGDSTWDCEAARRAGLPAIGLLTGGFSDSRRSSCARRARVTSSRRSPN